MLRVLLLIALLPMLPAQAAPRHDLDDPQLAAIVDGEPISQRAITLMHAVAQKRRPETTVPEVILSVVEDRLVAREARATYPESALISNNKVGYAPAIQIQERLVANFQAMFAREIALAVHAEKGGNLNGIVTRRRPVLPADWQAVFGKPRLLLELSLDEAGRKAAAAHVVLAYRLGGQNGTVTLLDVYSAQHVQGRNRLHARDSAFAMEQAQQLLERRYVLDWVQHRSGVSAADYQTLTRAVEDRLVREGWTNVIGVTSDIHSDNAHLKALAAAVTPAEVEAFYNANKEQFIRIERVRARHIRLADFEAANRAYARLQKGEDFSALAREVSLADSAAKGGELGWIEQGDRIVPWIESIAFVQKPGTVSRPFRSPGVAGGASVWEILLVDERIEGYQAVDSESVRYVAGQAVAKQKALAQYHETRERLLRTTDIRLNPALFDSADKPAAGVAR
ncbi:MAG: peptidylprolyl isomerase [Moraxellaceae bacterium]|nr:peptidylprolyl isomerase [Moraxellaceae bacterium]